MQYVMLHKFSENLGDTFVQFDGPRQLRAVRKNEKRFVKMRI